MANRTLSALFLPILVSVLTPLNAIQLRYHLKAGDLARFRMSLAGAAIVQVPMMEDTMRLQLRGGASMSRRVTGIGRDGVIELENRIEAAGFTTTSDGQEDKVTLPAEVSLVRMTSRGKIMSVKRVPQSAPEQDTAMFNAMLGVDPTSLLTTSSGLIFPEEEVKVGDSWKEESTVKISDEKTLTVKCAARLIDLVEVMGYKCAKIKATIRTPIAMNTASEEAAASNGIEAETKGFATSELTIYFAYGLGIPVYTEGSITGMNEASYTMPAEGMDLGMGDNDMSTGARMKMNLKTILQKGARGRE